jgi:DNA-binding LacI/PurR family transcriptional regulator
MRRSAATKSVSIKDVAREAGVSPSTVSRALQGHPRISREVRQRVRRVAREMSYVPSLPARSLVTQHTSTIGLAIRYVADPFLSRVAEGAEEEAGKHGYAIFMSSSNGSAEREEEVIRSFHEWRLSGVIVVGSLIDTRYLELREEYPLPIVLINCPIYPYSVTTDNAAGAKQAVEHLVQLGHRDIAYVSNPLSHLSNLNRLAGYQAVLNERGISFREELVVTGDGDMLGGMSAAMQLLALPQPPTGIFCFNDLTAIGAIRALNEAGRAVPQAHSVVGFDNLAMGEYFSPPLTTVDQPRYRLGQQAMRILLKLIGGQEEVEPETLPAELIVRESSGPAPITGRYRKGGDRA